MGNVVYGAHFTKVIIVFSEKQFSKGPLKYLTEKSSKKNNPCDLL
ncbi:hypothetical protein DBR06_SOUSAS29010016 [Sousa chinensis]|uniref:Uncharacterized protein n=1 Tax=Sousa chinensis TaxID=103600 RepID=A0A484H1C6_SOUCH|nr:hypothetical protein DBR06_SOUSAS29010016 [Sousa chinensis]